MKPYYEHKEITIYHGDCMEVMQGLDKVDLILTDPPYGVSYRSNHYIYGNPHGEIKNDNKLFCPLDDMWKLLKDTGSIFTFYSYKKPILDNRKKNDIIWVKNNWSAGDLTGDFGNQYETIAFMPKSKFKINGYRWSNVWNFNRIKPTLHPTEKPEELLKRIIECATVKGDTVLDIFAGVGSTLLASKLLSRKAIGIEIEEKYCEIAARRLQQEVFELI